MKQRRRLLKIATIKSWKIQKLRKKLEEEHAASK
jgi:hypothetical protein